MDPFWPRKSPHFLACRRSIRDLPVSAAATTPVIGLSGGPDSLALVAAVAAEGRDVRAVIVDHALQPGSAAVAERAAEQARALGIRAEVIRVEVAADAAAQRGLEAAAREARYAALFRVAPEVWVAHTADDQAETLLLGALRGNPAGMARVETRPEGALVRPFLNLRRADTVGACEELGLQYWRDPMNDDPAYRRVAIRHHIIPTLTDLLGGDAVPALAATADRIAEDRQLIAALADLTPTDNCEELMNDPAPIRRRRLAAWLLAHDVPVQAAQLADIERLVTNWKGQGPVHVAGAQVTRRAARLQVENQKP